jgi:hypothetical protein
MVFSSVSGGLELIVLAAGLPAFKVQSTDAAR